MTARSRLFRRPTLRVRLTLVYGAVFALAGVVLIGVMYALVQSRIGPSARAVVRMEGVAPSGATTSTQVEVPADDRLLLTDPGSVAGRIERELDAYNDRTLDSLLIWSLVALAVLLAVAAGAGWLVAGRVLRPLQEITATARRVADRSLDQRIALQGPQDELKELADTFDAMLGRLDQAFAGQRRFVADASHELRTPLAVNRTLIEVALGDPGVSDELRGLGRTLLATNERSERLIDGLLTLAAGEHELTRRAPVDLADVARSAVEQAAAEAAERGIRVESRIAPAPVTGDGLLLERLALNLVQNGLRHNVPGGSVEVSTSPDGDRARLVVSNTGPVVPPYEVDALFEPFRRLHAERTGSDRGVGLGLSIVRSVTRAHAGTVVATPNPTGGLTLTVTLPTTPTVRDQLP